MYPPFNLEKNSYSFIAHKSKDQSMSTLPTEEARVWIEDLMIPTYSIGKPEKNPMFFEKRVYQGSSGKVYPHPIIEKIQDTKVDKKYKAVFLENRYLKIMILPELGGRVQMAYDKIRQRHFVYYNQVVKPALVGLTGPWISGGIEFNWPQHHRPSTFEPVDFTVQENEDGSKTLWVNEVERMFRTKGMAGFTLYADKAYLEVKGKLYNRTPFPQTFLWWSNPAVKVNEDYQSIFPPDVHAVYDHGKRDVSSFPIATGTYYKVDYSKGVDISRYKNIPVPTSYMAVNSKYDFLGGYDHGSEHGLLHVANRHISPGKKQWTWGNKEFGLAWEKNLTDSDGPYIELMTGVFTDNQPDFSWLQPYEGREFVQYFMPYSRIGLVKNATKDAIVNIEVNNENVELKLYTTAVQNKVEIIIYQEKAEIFREVICCSPEAPFSKIIVFDQAAKPFFTHMTVKDLESSKLLVSYKPEVEIVNTIPNPAESAKKPEEVESIEKLYLIGLHLEQYRHATYNAEDYYREALKRDQNDIRCNNALGLWYLRRGKFESAIMYFRKAVSEMTSRNPNPYDGEPYYNLGLALKIQNCPEEAYEMFYKCTWNYAWQHAGFLQLSRIDLERGHFDKALENIEKSLKKNLDSNTARHIYVIILRKLGRWNDALETIERSLAVDPFHFGCLYEKSVVLNELKNDHEAETAIRHLKLISRNWAHNFIEYALDYAHCGLYKEAETLLQFHSTGNAPDYSMVDYYLGWFRSCQNDKKGAIEYFKRGAAAQSDFCFPNRIEDILILQNAIDFNPSDSKAHYYLGNLWYDKGQHTEAISCWKKSVELSDKFPTVLRNLALANYNKLSNSDQAVILLEKAFALDKGDARIFMELDQLYKRINYPHEKRLALLEKHLDLVFSRQDLTLERITILNQLGKYEKAKELIETYKFHPWEGGEGKVILQYNICHIELAKKCIATGKYQYALDLLGKTDVYPENIGEAKLYNTPESEISYWKGVAHEQAFNHSEALAWFKKATSGNSEPAPAVFYNDVDPSNIFYQGLAWRKLGEGEKSREIFNSLIDFGIKHKNDELSIDYFAVSLPDMLVFDSNINLLNKIHCLFMMGLGYLGLQNELLEQANTCFIEVLQMDKSHQGALRHNEEVNRLFNVPVN